MLQPTQSHITTTTDIEILKVMGYQIDRSLKDAADFINRNFRNLDLITLAAMSEISLGRLNDQSELIRIIEMTDGETPKLTFQLGNEEYDDHIMGLVIKRTFYRSNEGIFVKHILLVIPEQYCGQGLARSITQTWTQQYVNIGVSKIKVSSGLSVGGYAWAKNFFTADNRSEMDIILEKANANLNKRQMNAVQRIYDLYYTEFPGGKAFPIVEWAQLPFMKPILKGTYWEGTMDFNNSEQFSNFIKYIFR